MTVCEKEKELAGLIDRLLTHYDHMAQEQELAANILERAMAILEELGDQEGPALPQ